MQSIFRNKQFGRDFTLVDKFEAGLVLEGWEVKSIKSAHLTMQGSFVYYTPSGELLLRGASVTGWKTGELKSPAQQNRDRKLLVSRTEAMKIGSYAKQPGYTVIPVELYVNDRGLIKLEIAVVKGKKKYEKREKIKEREMQRKIRQHYRR